MTYLMKESDRRRNIQSSYNKDNKIRPTTVQKSLDEIMVSTSVADSAEDKKIKHAPNYNLEEMSKIDKKTILSELKNSMKKHAENMEFEIAASIRDEILQFEEALGRNSK